MQTLVVLEQQFWTADADFYREHLVDEGQLVLPAPAGLIDKATTVDSIAAAPRWSTVRMSDVRLLRLEDDVAWIGYRAEAQRHGGVAYRTFASSVYVRRDDGWKLACHQQTPIV